MKRVVIIVHGRVQGVFFRYTTQIKAEELNLTGWICNEPDGSVKIVAEGEEKSLKTLIQWCHQGPGLAKINKVEVKWSKATGEFQKFSIRY